jgi:DNA modification methylase
MDITNQNREGSDINVDSLWLIGPRAKGGKRENNYHGNFVPQIPEQMIRRYTQAGGIVLDMFMGSGTALFEAETLGRPYIGFDINDDIIANVCRKMEGSNAEFLIHNCDITDTKRVSLALSDDLIKLQNDGVDLILSHPPYLNIVKFTDKKEDLSNIEDLSTFIDSYLAGVKNVWPFLKKNQYFVLVIGDVWRNSEVVPLGFLLMNAIKRTFTCKLKGIVVKDMEGNRGKLGAENIWRYRALKSGNFLFKHEYIFVFRKI